LPLNIIGVLLMLIGAIWFLQGVNVLPGSFMIGQIRWALYGGIATRRESGASKEIILPLACRRKPCATTFTSV
jgi:hypothetical protein